ncbi:hypothetical protein MMC07_005430 [Pseudocyphellaria aurata]|nr:hypothetical protein [Pseudocyphellaria aurata]
MTLFVRAGPQPFFILKRLTQLPRCSLALATRYSRSELSIPISLRRSITTTTTTTTEKATSIASPSFSAVDVNPPPKTTATGTEAPSPTSPTAEQWITTRFSLEAPPPVATTAAATSSASVSSAQQWITTRFSLEAPPSGKSPATATTRFSHEASRPSRPFGLQTESQIPALLAAGAPRLDPTPYVAETHVFPERVNAFVVGFLVNWLFESDRGARDFFSVPLERAYQISTAAYSQIGGITHTVRGSSMSASARKIRVVGIEEVNGERVLVLKFIKCRHPA